MYGFLVMFSICMNFRKSRILNISWDVEQKVKISMTVSYTHLTLPTSDLV